MPPEDAGYQLDVFDLGEADQQGAHGVVLEPELHQAVVVFAEDSATLRQMILEAGDVPLGLGVLAHDVAEAGSGRVEGLVVAVDHSLHGLVHQAAPLLERRLLVQTGRREGAETKTHGDTPIWVVNELLPPQSIDEEAEEKRTWNLG